MIRRTTLAALVAVLATMLVAATAAASPYVDRLLATAVHADVSIVKLDGTIVAQTYDRGRITAASSDSITLLRRDGQSVTLVVNSSTKLPRRELGVNRQALVVSRAGVALRVQLGYVTARRILAPGGALVRNGLHADVTVKRANGTTRTVAVDRGRVTAKSETSLTIQRADGVTLTLALDAKTRVGFGRRGVRGARRLKVGANGVAVSEAGKAVFVHASARALGRG